MNKNLKELKEIVENERDFNSMRLQDFVLYYLIPVLEDFEKRTKISGVGQKERKLIPE